MELRMDHTYLLELLDYEGKSLVGKMCKRFEIISPIVKDRAGNISEIETLARVNLLKNEAKELIYEEIRHIRDLLLAGGRGLEQKVFKYNK